MKKVLSAIRYRGIRFIAELNKHHTNRQAYLIALLYYIENLYEPINELEYE